MADDGWLTDELDKHPNDHDLPSARDTVDEQGGVTSETEIPVDGGTEVIADSSDESPGLGLAPT
jgi:hypothetical protein